MSAQSEVCPYATSGSALFPAGSGPPSVCKPEFVARSRFVVANGMVAEVKEAFRNRPHLVEGTAGFLRMDVLSPLNRPEEIWLLTYWTDAQSYKEWHHSHRYHDSHRGIPKGLKLVPGETEILELEHVCS
ncbi:MAG: antibiotic biosynthesis monooxygenase [Verrucomicrobiota bacterium]